MILKSLEKLTNLTDMTIKRKSIKLKLFSLPMVAGIIATASMMPRVSFAQQTAPGSIFCAVENGQPFTMVNHPERGRIQLIKWQTPYFTKGGWDPMSRCLQASKKFEENQRSGKLKAIVPGYFNGHNVLCAYPSSSIPSNPISCADERVLMTLTPDQNAIGTIEHLKEININPVSSSDPLISSNVLLNNGKNRGLHFQNWVRVAPESNTRPSSTGCQQIWGCP
jgi:hypothetical protein